MSFTHLQIRSSYSLFASTIKIEKLIERAKRLHFHSLTLTDEGVLYGVIPFYKACIKNNIKPIIGLIVHVHYEEEVIQCTLLAKNNVGYERLMELSTAIQTGNECTIETLQKVNEALICIVPTSNSFLQKELREGTYTTTIQYIELFQEIFAEENVYLGIERASMLAHEGQIDALQQLNIQATVLQDVRYLEEKDVMSYDSLQAMKRAEQWEYTSIAPASEGKHLCTIEEIESLWTQWPQLLTANEAIVAACNVEFQLNTFKLPQFPVPTEQLAHDYLVEQCEQALENSYQGNQTRAHRRLAHELSIIKTLGFSDYFLIVADIVAFAKANDILVGPGRGSAASSLVSYLLGITTVDPLQYDLLFERFLNPERVSMPDIDIDFSDVRRDEVIQYVREKYGQEKVAQIITFGTFAARSVLRELMKIMDVDQRDQTYILQHIPTGAHKPLLTYIESSPPLKEYIKQSPKMRVLFSVALKLEGIPRHTSTHAAGLVISNEQLLRDVPLQAGTDDTYLTQYAMHELEAIGLLKIDILGLSNLSFIERILKSIQTTMNETINLESIPDDDAKTFQLLQQGKTNGIFQLESAGMKRVLTELKPTVFEDIVAINALYRPGPMEHIPQYIERKHGKKSFSYVHDDLKPILEPTYGVLIYQEQIMQVANQFANFSLGEADTLRKAMSKKERSLMEKQRARFIDGSVANGYERAIAEQIFSWIAKFADYGFPKSHAVAYSKIGYQLAYLKANYPLHFFAQLLGTLTSNRAKLNAYIREANALGIELLPPSINHSYGAYSIEGNKIRIGLLAIRGVGVETVKEIVRTRKERPFTDLFDFCLRTSDIKRPTLETLILAGAFDETYTNRASLLASISQAIERAELFGDVAGQGSLFAESLQMRPDYTDIADFSRMKKLADEMDLLGMYVSTHPLKQFRDVFTQKGYLSLKEVQQYKEKQRVQTVGIIQQLREIKTKQGQTMAFATVVDENEAMEVVIFPNVHREVGRHLDEDIIISIDGRISIRNDKKQIIGNTITLLSLEDLEKEQKQTGTLFIRLKQRPTEATFQFLQSISHQFRGTTPVIIYDEQQKKSYKLDGKYALHATDPCLLNLMSHFGTDNVVMRK